METIGFENIVATLLLLGYDNIDSSLYNEALEIIILSEDFELQKVNNYAVRKLLTRDNNSIRFKNGVNINSKVMINNKLVPVRKVLEYSSNKLLLDYLKDIKPNDKKMKRLVK